MEIPLVRRESHYRADDVDNTFILLMVRPMLVSISKRFVKTNKWLTWEEITRLGYERWPRKAEQTTLMIPERVQALIAQVDQLQEAPNET